MKLLELIRAWLTIDLHPVLFFNGVCTNDLAKHPVSGQQQQTFAITIQSSNSHCSLREISPITQQSVVWLAWTIVDELTQRAIGLMETKIEVHNHTRFTLE